MIALAIDAARGGFSTAVAQDDRIVATRTLPGNQALERGLEALAQTLSEAGIAPEEIDRLGVGIGPGSFTGVRIAISYAKSLAQAWRLPLVGVTTFDALEFGARPQGGALGIVRGRTGVVSVRLRRANGEVVRASGYIHDALAELGNGPGSLELFGDAEDVLAGLAERGFTVTAITDSIGPTAAAIALAALQREPARSAHEVRADYGELPAVTPRKSAL